MSTITPCSDSYLELYKETKAKTFEIMGEIKPYVKNKNIFEAAKSVSLTSKKRLKIPDENTELVFADYFYYSWPEKGKSLIHTVKTQNENLLPIQESMINSIYSVYSVDPYDECRVLCKDVFRGKEEILVTDINLAKTIPGNTFFLAARVLNFIDFSFFSGGCFVIASRELVSEMAAKLLQFLQKINERDIDDLNGRQKTIFESIVIKTCIKHKAYLNFTTTEI